MIPTRLKHNRQISQLCFGTAQLGLDYGIANQTGMPDEHQSGVMLAAAYEAGVTLFDTARAYGESESRVGNAMVQHRLNRMTVLTKLAPLDAAIGHISVGELRDTVTESIKSSLHHLGLSCLPYLQLHRAAHLHAAGGVIWEQLLTLRSQGLIERFGVSVASPDEALESLSIPEVECLQLPCNLLDGRWEKAGIPALLSRRPEVLVLARSSLLQGLLTQDASKWPILPAPQAQAIGKLLDGWVVEFGRKHRADLCLAFVRGQSWIDSIIVGMETMLQVEENLDMFQSHALTAEACAQISSALPVVPETLLNPALWPKAQA